MCVPAYMYSNVSSISEGPYISLFGLLRESSPRLPQPLAPPPAAFCLSPPDPANPPTHPFSVFTAAAKGLLQMLEGFFCWPRI